MSDYIIVIHISLIFFQTETMLATAEALLGPYVWGQYDLLILPPSFPYGGMENPCLTFVTPTLLVSNRASSKCNEIRTKITSSGKPAKRY